MKKIFIISVFAAAFSLLSCATIKEIPENLTSAQIIQMGQNSLVAGDYKSAEFCYETVIQRFGSNPSTFVEAKYELGNAYYKAKKYQEAYDTFTELLDIYGYSQGNLPGAYKKLAQIGMDKIPASKIKKSN